MLTLLENGELRNRMSEASRRRVTDFSMDCIRRRRLDLWSDLLARPAAARNPCAALQIERPQYYNWFQHFASTQLSPSAVLETTRRSQREAIVDGVNQIKRCARADVLDSIFGALDAADGLTTTEVATMLGENIAAPVLLWHVMWALKHGLLRVRSEGRT